MTTNLWFLLNSGHTGDQVVKFALKSQQFKQKLLFSSFLFCVFFFKQYYHCCQHGCTLLLSLPYYWHYTSEKQNSRKGKTHPERYLSFIVDSFVRKFSGKTSTIRCITSASNYLYSESHMLTFYTVEKIGTTLKIPVRIW